ncbi:rod-binding protein [Limnohabitans sp. Rim11]|uniref:rod-binding protein n=1 Tax=Limnohabitans sp. Rim11 TaxID=1100719 RepID=UPI000ABCEA63|nr:rod-binding protein [Limnohabitans sp. Rim11]
MDALNNSTTSSYLDFDGLGQLKGQARQDAKGAIRETAQQFEALFLQMMMKSMRESIVKSELSESNTMETFEGMFDKEVSVQLAKKNSMGLADMLVKNLEQQQANVATTAEILKQRQDPAAFTAKPMPLNPVQLGMPLDKLLPKQNGFALPKPQMFPLNLPAKPISGSGS